MSQIHVVDTEYAPRAVGPYSQAIIHHGLIYASGQIGLDPATGKLVGGDVLSQASQVMSNLGAVLNEAGASLSDILKVNIFLTDMNDFSIINKVYAGWLAGHRPARATIAVAALPLGARVEMDLVARVAGSM